jgi:hypothetical protein
MFLSYQGYANFMGVKFTEEHDYQAPQHTQANTIGGFIMKQFAKFFSIVALIAVTMVFGMGCEDSNPELTKRVNAFETATAATVDSIYTASYTLEDIVVSADEIAKLEGQYATETQAVADNLEATQEAHTDLDSFRRSMNEKAAVKSTQVRDTLDSVNETTAGLRKSVKSLSSVTQTESPDLPSVPKEEETPRTITVE